MACVFCSIVEGRAPASFVYRDDQCLAFMDIRPARPGHLLLIPRVHVDHFYHLPDDLAAQLTVIGNRIARVLREIYQPPRVGILVHGFGVPHAHLNILPLHHPWDLTSQRYGYVDEGVVKYAWEKVALAERAALDADAARVATELGKHSS